ncbi:tRNA pseudouridine synthase B [Nakamurella panacisegetis]|uniref:tRNA pseudouridine synthase B n=1 Tax=Nakamurella panacisegetis TaxID=1090615 RepID=A0A1H0SJ90_9ACTN|nr:tRNA pseudouridine(55) synthase TruB [Nakamurella panacisegetis]SDP41814.1 tRNA pseudouridine synthase B [Nakamurella panacisegetis]
MSDLVGGGLLLVDKPAGCTSHDVVGRLRRVLGTKKVGHAGTLDPMATGLLVIAVERSTKLLGHLSLTDKTYLATIRLGSSTTTDDAEGKMLATAEPAALDAVTDDAVTAVIGTLTGPILQVPSSVSAIKVDGQRAYDRVRAGEQVELAARPVTIHRFDVLGPIRRGDDAIDLDVLVECTTGTYIRSLARDLGAALGVGGHLTALRRTTVGPFAIAGAVDVYGPDGVPERGGPRPEITAEFSARVAAAIIPAADAVRLAFATRDVDGALARDVRYGRPVPASGIPGVYGLLHDGDLLALVEESGGQARPRLVFDPA